MTQFLFVTLGTGGNINPFVGLGIALRQRGHRVTVIANEHHERQIRGEGLGFARMGSMREYDRVLRHPDMWHPQRSTGLLFDFAVSVIPEGYAAIARLHEPGNTVVAAVPFAFAARIAHATLRVPFVTVALTPVFLPSSHDPPYVQDSFDPESVVSRINAFRARLGLTPIRQAARWINSPRRIIALWPDWYYAPQPDWPPHALTTGFIEYEGASAGGWPSERGGPDAGGLPERVLVFTAGSINCQARDFFATAGQACQALGLPGLLVTRDEGQLPRAMSARTSSAGGASRRLGATKTAPRKREGSAIAASAA